MERDGDRQEERQIEPGWGGYGGTQQILIHLSRSMQTFASNSAHKGLSWPIMVAGAYPGKRRWIFPYPKEPLAAKNIPKDTAEATLVLQHCYRNQLNYLGQWTLDWICVHMLYSMLWTHVDAYQVDSEMCFPMSDLFWVSQGVGGRYSWRMELSVLYVISSSSRWGGFLVYPIFICGKSNLQLPEHGQWLLTSVNQIPI